MTRWSTLPKNGRRPGSEGSRAGEEDETPPTRPVRAELDASDRAIARAVFAGNAGLPVAFPRYTSMEPDEGIVLEGAQRILRGEVPYRDSFPISLPGLITFWRCCSKFSEARFWWREPRWFSMADLFGGSLTYWRAGYVSGASAIFVSALVTLTTLPYRSRFLHNWDSTLWACLAVYYAVAMAGISALEVDTRTPGRWLLSLAFLSSRKEPGWCSVWARAWWRLLYWTGNGPCGKGL